MVRRAKQVHQGGAGALLSKELGWEYLGSQYRPLTNGSQNAFFYLFNLLAGEFADGRKKKVLFPLAPKPEGALWL